MKRYACSVCGEELTQEEIGNYFCKHEGLDFDWGKCDGEDARLVEISDTKSTKGEVQGGKS